MIIIQHHLLFLLRFKLSFRTLLRPLIPSFRILLLVIFRPLFFALLHGAHTGLEAPFSLNFQVFLQVADVLFARTEAPAALGGVRAVLTATVGTGLTFLAEFARHRREVDALLRSTFYGD